MLEPLWLNKADILPMHEASLFVFGGASGLRDEGLLESALGSPRNHFGYGETDLFRLAAHYAYALAKNHPFVDGNKRVAFLAAYVFLDVNGWKLQAPEAEVVEVMLALAAGKLTADELTEWLRKFSARAPAKAPKKSKSQPVKKATARRQR